MKVPHRSQALAAHGARSARSARSARFEDRRLVVLAGSRPVRLAPSPGSLLCRVFARARGNAASAWCPCATARPARPTHSAERTSPAASGAVARRRGGPAPSTPSSAESRPGPPAWPVRSWSARAHRECAARRSARAATDTTAAAAAAPQDTPATPARPHSQPASGATTCAPWPLKRNSAPPPRAEKHPPRSNGSTANGHPRRACIYRLPRPVLLRSGSVVAA